MKKILLLLLLVNTSCNSQESIKLKNNGGVYTTEITLNDKLSTNFVIDTGCSISSVPSYIAMTLYQTGTIKTSDLLQDSIAILADGSKVEVHHFIMREVKIGDKVLKNIEFTIVDNQESPLLLGQNILKKLDKITIDYKNNTLSYE